MQSSLQKVVGEGRQHIVKQTCTRTEETHNILIHPTTGGAANICAERKNKEIKEETKKRNPDKKQNEKQFQTKKYPKAAEGKPVRQKNYRRLKKNLPHCSTK